MILGNPPYGRVPAQADGAGRAREGWAHWGGGHPLLDDYVQPLRREGGGAHLKNLHNLYVYFWRWACWRAFEVRGTPGIVAFVTASSFVRGPGFGGMREQLRRRVDEIHVLDLGGAARGPRAEQNVFGVATPICVTALLRLAQREPQIPAEVRYERAQGSREEKLAACQSWRLRPGSRRGEPERPPRDWQAPLLEASRGAEAGWPKLAEIFPWRHSGAQFKRTWPIAADPETLERRFHALLAAPAAERGALFRESRDRKLDRGAPPLEAGARREPPLASLALGAEAPRPRRYGFRSWDRQYCLADARLGDFLRPSLWAVAGQTQIFLTSLLSGGLGPGPAATVSAHVPDLHHFRGSYGGRDVIPLWRDAEGQEPNLCPRFWDRLEGALGARPVAEDVFAYAYAILANPGYGRRFEETLAAPGLPLPFTRSPGLFARGAALGRELIRWHTYGERFRSTGDGFALHGDARIRRAIGERDGGSPRSYAFDAEQARLRIGEGEIAPISAEVMELRVSGLPILKSWLGHRMRAGAGRRSSPLDRIRPERWSEAMSEELLALIWSLEWTIARYATLENFLENVLQGPLLGPLPADP